LYDLNTAISPATVSYASENSGGDSHWGFISYIGRFNYDYKKKYLLEVLGRRDGSSKFDASNRWSNFYDVSVGWRLLQEPIFHALTPYVNELKVRADYGETGGQANIGNYDYLAVVSLGTALFGSTPAMETSSSANAIVTDQRTWERMRNKNLGIDFGFLQNRLTGSVDIFEKQNIGMLISLVYPSILGGTAPTTNSGTLRTRGWEVSLAWKDKAGPVTYNIGVVLSDAHNVVTSYAGANTWAAGNYTTPRVGYPLNQLYVYKTDGYFKTQAEADAYFAQYGASGNAAGYNGATNTFHPGDLKVVDLDGDGKITATGTGKNGSGDAYFYGDADPHYSFGLNLGASWKGFDFSTFIQGVAKWNILRTGNARAPFFRNYLNVNTTYIGKTYTAQNPNAEYPRLSFDNSINNWNWQYNDVNIQHLRYARLKTLVLGYSLPSSWAARIKATRIRFYFAANDLWEITSVRDGFDPERGNSSDSSYPFMRTKSFGLDLGF
jgi:TonB-linked SusC/RagA family outer membrane protein